MPIKSMRMFSYIGMFHLLFDLFISQILNAAPTAHTSAGACFPFKKNRLHAKIKIT